jgi:23S rRNA (adenine2503-C2)-methyltransferase
MPAPLALLDSRPALSDLDQLALEQWAEANGLPRYRARQLHSALHGRYVQSFDEITELPAALRTELARDYRVRSLTRRIHLHSVDGSEKVLFGLGDGQAVETVLIRGRNAGGTSRNTVCVSSQVGCPAGCTFCATGLSGFGRNLTGAEIADQVMYFAHQLARDGERVTNVVYMGMGEPLLNVRAVGDSIARLTDPAGFGLGRRSITVSTVGIVPQIRKFSSWAGQVNLALSLHAPSDALRERLVPYNRHFPIADLLEAVTEYVAETHRRVSFEYVLLRGVNDSEEVADELAALLRPLGGYAHVNLIPWNPFRDGKFVRSEGPDADAFARRVRAGGVAATIRYSRGLDISAACGQLRERQAG